MNTEIALLSLPHSEIHVQKDTIVGLWLETLPSDLTRKNYKYKIKSFMRQSGLDPFKLNAFQIDEYLKKAMAEKMNIGSLKGQLIALNSFYRYAQVKDPSIENPIKRISIRLPNQGEREAIRIRKRALSLELIQNVFEKFNEYERRRGIEPPGGFLFRFLINTGMRISEALSLEFYDPKKESDDYINYLKVSNNRGYIFVMGKGRRPREFFLNHEFTAYLLKHELDPGKRLILNQKGQPLTSRGALYWMKQIENRYLKGESIYKFCNHSLRHTYCTLQVKRNESPINIAKTVGNSVAMIEKVYLSEAKDINAGFCII